MKFRVIKKIKKMKFGASWCPLYLYSSIKINSWITQKIDLINKKQS